MDQEIIDAYDKKRVRKYSVLHRAILFYYAICLISTFIYWVYYKSVTQQVVTDIHFKFRRFIFSNYVREIILLSLILGVLYALVHALKNKKYKLLFVSVVVLILEIVLFNQLQISEGA